VTDTAWIDAALTSARPQALGALLRYFRNLDTAEEAFQNACLRALKSWPRNGPPRDAAAWLIMVGRNVAIDELRRGAKQEPLPSDDAISDLDDAEDALAERLDGSHYRDDILRLLFICCHPDLPATQQIALALRIVSGLSVKQIARAFLVSEAAMEQRITRAKARVAEAGVPFETPGAVERSERLIAVAAIVYLIFNEGYSASGDTAGIRRPLCEEAIRLARLLLRLFQSEPEIMGLTALLAAARPRRCALRPGWRAGAAGRSGPPLVESQHDRRGAGADRQGDAASRQRAVPDPGGDRRPSCPRRKAGGYRLGADRSALRRAGGHAAVAGGDAEPRGRGVQGARPHRRA
jgi:RNA polymerase sigma-70 factor (ECF subfamily)